MELPCSLTAVLAHSIVLLTALQDPFWDPPEDFFLGSVFLYLQSLLYHIDTEETLSITNYQGKRASRSTAQTTVPLCNVYVPLPLLCSFLVRSCYSTLSMHPGTEEGLLHVTISICNQHGQPLGDSVVVFEDPQVPRSP